MGSNTWNPDEWPSIVEYIRSGGPDAGRRLAERERNHDNLFQRYNEADYAPTITQNSVSATYTEYIFKGYRVGSFVNLEFRARITNTPGLGGITITVPPALPIAQSPLWDASLYGGPIVGTLTVAVSASDTWYSGMARSQPTTVFGTLSGYNTTMGSVAPVVGLVPGDQVGYHLSYLTSAVL